jgi:superfamily II DNA or RNA helicase
MSDYWFKITKLNNVYAHASTNHPSLMRDLYLFLYVYVEGYRFMPKYKAGIWDGRVPFMEKNGNFQIGLIRYIYEFVKQDGLKIHIDPSLLERIDGVQDDLADVTNEWMSDEFVPRDYQFEGAVKALFYKRGILEHATSAGKSLTMSIMIMYALKKKLASKVLILVPGIGLVKQLTSDFQEYGVPPDLIGQYYGLQKDTDNPIIISTWQSMCVQPELTQTFDMIIVDETHGLKGNVVRSVAENAINANIRIGVTGTMPENKDSQYAIEGALGPVLHKITAKQLIEQKHASDIIIKVPFINYPKSIAKELKGITYDMEKKWLEEYDQRNSVIKVIANKHLEKGQNLLVLVDHISHGEALVQKMNELEGVETFFVTGDTHPDERERIRKYTNDHEKVVIVATYGVFSTGISIKRLHSVIFASAGKSKIRVLQSIGRGLRLHKDKKKLILYDIGDSLTYSEKHLRSRIAIYDKAEFSVDAFEINLENDNNAII